MSRIEHEDWACRICNARGYCAECSSLGTADAYDQTQALCAAAMQDEDGLAASVLEKIAWWPDDCLDRAYWIERVIRGALTQLRIEA